MIVFPTVTTASIISLLIHKEKDVNYKSDS